MRFLMLIGCAGLLWGQGTEPKHQPEDYEVHAQAGPTALGAEFMVHSFSRGEQTFIAQDYLVVEVALFPPKGETIVVENGNFSLRVNGKKQVLLPQPSSMVAAALQHPEWEQQRGMTPSIGGGLGNTGVILGGPPRTQPIPGSNPPGSQPMPPVQVPPYDPTGMRKEPVKADVLVVETALVEGPHHSAISGFLYFPFRGKISSIKTLELVYQDAVLKLR